RIRSIPPPAVWLKWLIPRVSHDGFGMAADELAPEDLDAAGVVTRCDQDDAIASQFVKPFGNRAHLCGCFGISPRQDPNGRGGHARPFQDCEAVKMLRCSLDFQPGQRDISLRPTALA